LAALPGMARTSSRAVKVGDLGEHRKVTVIMEGRFCRGVLVSLKYAHCFRKLMGYKGLWQLGVGRIAFPQSQAGQGVMKTMCIFQRN
jgi:hypothetical protein